MIYVIYSIITFICLNIIFKKEKNKLLFSFIVSILVCAMSYSFNNYIMYPSDTVVINAYNKSNSKAQGTAIVFNGVRREEKKLKYKVVDGTWLDLYNTQSWRDDDNLTNSIKLKIKKGTDRHLEFRANKWTGIFDVSLNGGYNSVIDSYGDHTDNDNHIDVKLQDTDVLHDISFDNIIIFALEFFILSAIIILLLRKKSDILKFIKKYKIDVIYVFLALMGFMLMLIYADDKSLWLDDTSTMSYMYKGSLLNVIKYIMTEDHSTAPLYTILFYFWSKFIPVGATKLTLWIKLPSIIFVALGHYFIAVFARRAWNKYVGIIAEVISVCSSTLILSAAYQARPYGLLVPFSAILMYFLTVRLEEEKKNNLKTTISYALSILAIAFTHYFGALLCFALFIFETVLFFKKQYTWKYLQSYIIAGIIFIPWITYIAISWSAIYGGVFWTEIPTIHDVLLLFVWFLSDYYILFILFVFAIISMLYKLFTGVYYKKKILKDRYLDLALSLGIIVPILMIYIYSIGNDEESSMWVNRYFLYITPIVICIVAQVIYIISEFIFSNIKQNANIETNRYVAYCLLTVFFIVTVGNLSMSKVRDDSHTIYHPYREVADYLLDKGDIYRDDTLIIATYYFSNGWDYYLTHNGKFKKVSYVQNLDNIDINKYNKVYLFEILFPLNEKDKNLIESKFKSVKYNADLSLLEYTKEEKK